MHDYAGNPTATWSTVPLVDDADLNPPTAANVDQSGQVLADRTALLRAQRGTFYEVHRVPIVHADISPFNNSWVTLTPTAGVWVAATTPASWAGVFTDATTGDHYDIEFDGSIQIAGGGGNVYGLSLFVQETFAGPIIIGSMIPGSAKYFYQTGTTTTQYGFHLTGQVAATSAITGGVSIALGMFGSTTAGITLIGDYTLNAKLLRPTS